ncbi:MAG: type II secretion system F family protein, partial [Planctomyces sp.]
VRERFRIMGLINTLTAEGRLQALILMALPPFLLVIMIFLNRDYTQSLLDHPELLVGMAGSMGLGWLWIRKIVNFDF